MTLVERQVVGGAAHLRDCIPSKTMTATAVRIDSMRNAAKLGVVSAPGQVDPKQLTERIESITGDINRRWVSLLRSQGVEIIEGTGRLVGPNEAIVETDAGTRRVEFDRCLISTGSAPRVPPWAKVDGERVLTTREAYGLPEIPKHMVVIGSGVTGVEFVHIFESLGSDVTLVVSRQQILPHRDPEVAAVLEDNFLERGVKLLIGARATGIERIDDGVVVICDDGRKVSGTHALLAIGSIPLTTDLGLEELGIITDNGFLQVDEYQRTNLPHIYGAGDCTGQMLLSSVGAMQGRKIARHAMGLQVVPIDYSKVSQAVFTEPEIASVGLEDSESAGQGRKVERPRSRSRPMPERFSKAIPRGFVKVISDPATGVVSGGNDRRPSGLGTDRNPGPGGAGAGFRSRRWWRR